MNHIKFAEHAHATEVKRNTPVGNDHNMKATAQPATGPLQWLATHTRPDLAVGTRTNHATGTEAATEDIAELNKLVRHAHHGEDLTVWIQATPT